MQYFDTHAHYTDKRFTEEHEGGADKLLPTLFFDSDVRYIVNVATNMNNAHEVITQAAKYSQMFAAVGIHPSDCVDFPNVDRQLKELRSLLDNRRGNKIVALGEIGLDYYWDTEHKDLQKEYFTKQLDIACEYEIPVIVHDREAHGDVFETLIQYENVKGVLHSFSGSPEMALELTRRGWYISFSGVISFKNARKARDVAAVVPEDKILIETDCPYLTPEPFRGKLNRSDYLIYTLEALANARNVDAESLGNTVFQNSCNFFGI